jgi:hypothetical protein
MSAVWAALAARETVRLNPLLEAPADQYVSHGVERWAAPHACSWRPLRAPAGWATISRLGWTPKPTGLLVYY